MLVPGSGLTTGRGHGESRRPGSGDLHDGLGNGLVLPFRPCFAPQCPPDDVPAVGKVVAEDAVEH